jgi:sugar lactone lactonase YvrE
VARFDHVEVVVPGGAQLGEGPVWDAERGLLAWVDIPARLVHLTAPRSGATRSIEVPLDVGAVALRTSGGFVAALQDGFWVIDDGPPRRIAEVPGTLEAGIRFNDGACDPDGRFWAGTMAYDQRTGAASLYRLDVDGSVHRMLDGLTIGNGLAWDASGRVMYYIDTPTHRIDAFAFDPASGSLSGRRTVVRVPPGSGAPDGMTIDAEGGLWVALWGGAAVHRYLDGNLDRVIDLPVTQPTSATFGGAGLDELFITSASMGLSPQQRRDQPLAGAVLRVRPGVRGVLGSPYAG